MTGFPNWDVIKVWIETNENAGARHTGLLTPGGAAGCTPRGGPLRCLSGEAGAGGGVEIALAAVEQGASGRM
jgi:hypothetical protein